MATLYRCSTPTNWLCSCGRVARELKKAGVSYEQIRLPNKKRDRPEIEELTGQRLLPVLVDGEEVISDSHRIVEYLRQK